MEVLRAIEFVFIKVPIIGINSKKSYLGTRVINTNMHNVFQTKHNHLLLSVEYGHISSEILYTGVQSKYVLLNYDKADEKYIGYEALNLGDSGGKEKPNSLPMF